MEAQIVAVIFAAIIFLVISELFGTRKHIGRWWSFGLLLGGIVPGIIAIALSPSAKSSPTKGSQTHTISGWIFIILGVLSMIPAFTDENARAGLGFSFSFIITGIYLVQLGKSNIVNQSPKYYFENMSETVTSSSIGQSVSKIVSDIPKPHHVISVPESLYYIVENNISSEPLTYDQLKLKRIKADTLVCRNGQTKWSKAMEIRELQGLIIFEPPPFPESLKNDEVSGKHFEPNTEEQTLEVVISKPGENNKNRNESTLAVIVGTAILTIIVVVIIALKGQTSHSHLDTSSNPVKDTVTNSTSTAVYHEPEISTKSKDSIQPKPVEPTTTITIKSNLVGALLSIDEISVGYTPYRGQLTYGRHTIYLNSDNKGYEDNIEVKHGGKIHFYIKVSRDKKLDKMFEDFSKDTQNALDQISKRE